MSASTRPRVLADCDRLDALSEAIEGLGETHDTPPAPQDGPTTDAPQG